MRTSIRNEKDTAAKGIADKVSTKAKSLPAVPVLQQKKTSGNVIQLNPDEEKKPFVELADKFENDKQRRNEEKQTAIKTGLLGTALATDENMRKKSKKKDKPQYRGAEYLYHATTYKNLITILQKGLDPDRGGSEVGASMLAKGQLKDDSLKGSKGFVHGATQSAVALHYANKFDKKENTKEAREVSGFSVMLKFRVKDKGNWTEDTEDRRGNYKTQILVPPADIQYLDLQEGWQPLTNINLEDLKLMVAGSPEQHEMLEHVEVPKQIENTSMGANLTTIDFSSMGKSITPSQVQLLIQAISDGALPSLNSLTLHSDQINETQKEKLSEVGSNILLKFID